MSNDFWDFFKMEVLSGDIELVFEILEFKILLEFLNFQGFFQSV